MRETWEKRGESSTGKKGGKWDSQGGENWE